MHFVLFNGQIIEKKNLSFYDVERFRVADACFESMLWIDGRIPLLDGHQKRLDEVCTYFGFDSHKISLDSINQLAKIEKIKTNYRRVRVSVIRSQGKNYTPLGKESNLLVEMEELEDLFLPIQKLGLYRELRKSVSPFSRFKHSNALLYVMARQFALKNNFDEVLLFNDNNQIIEASSSNLFFIRDQEIYTPNRNDGGVTGVCQERLINLFGAKEVKVTEQIVQDADEIFLSNAVQLIEPVTSFLNRKLDVVHTKKLIAKLKEDLTL